MSFITYQMLRQLQTVGKGATKAKRGHVNAIIKQDGHEALAQVYCEFVACRLAALVSVPVASGVLVSHDNGLKYASLVISEVNLKLHDVEANRLAKLVKRYPVECAKLAVFDLWIGNPDRLGNVRANLGSSSDHIIVGVDHGGSLLNCSNDRKIAVENLSNRLWPTRHAFGSGLPHSCCDAIVTRIERLDDNAINDACVIGDTVGSVMLPEQAELAEILNLRRVWLRDMVDRVLRPI